MRARTGVFAGLLAAVATAAGVDARSCPIPETYPVGSLDGADLVVVVYVSEIAREKGLLSSLGDWAFVATGYRLGLPSSPDLRVRAIVSAVLKGRAAGVLELVYAPASPEHRGYGQRLASGTRYVVVTRGEPPRIQAFADVDRDPDVLDVVRSDLARRR